MLLTTNVSAESIYSALVKFNSYSFFREHEALLVTGPTQTNVMDIVIAIIE